MKIRTYQFSGRCPSIVVYAGSVPLGEAFTIAELSDLVQVAEAQCTCQ